MKPEGATRNWMAKSGKAQPQRAREVAWKIAEMAEARAANSFWNVSDLISIARLAYSNWETRGRHGGSLEEDWLRAEQEFQRRRAVAA